jgi:uridine kinase
VSTPPALEVAAREAVARCLAAPPTLGAGRLLCVDGPSGSGKTTFAREVRRAVPTGTSVRVVHLDALYPGWDGLAAGVERVARDLLAPLADGCLGGYRRYDWHRGQDAEWVEVEPVDLLVLEGVGAGGDASCAPWVTLLVWVEAARDVRTGRALERDGLATEAELRAWWQQEDAWFAEHRTRDRADLVVVNEE